MKTLTLLACLVACGGGSSGAPDAQPGDAQHGDAPSSCQAETDAAFCSRLHMTCGMVTGTDACGAPRTALCGTTAAPAPVACQLVPAAIRQGSTGVAVVLSGDPSGDFTGASGAIATHMQSGIDLDGAAALAGTGVMAATGGSLAFTLAVPHAAALGTRTIVVAFPTFTLTAFDALTVTPIFAAASGSAGAAGSATAPLDVATARNTAQPGDTVELQAGHYTLSAASLPDGLCPEGVTIRGEGSAYTYQEGSGATTLPAADTVIDGAGLSGTVDTSTCAFAATVAHGCTLSQLAIEHADCALRIAPATASCTAPIAPTLDHVTLFDDGAALSVANGATVTAHALDDHMTAAGETDTAFASLQIAGTCASLAIDQGSMLDHEVLPSAPLFAAAVTGDGSLAIDTSTIAGFAGRPATSTGVINVDVADAPAAGAFSLLLTNDLVRDNANAAVTLKTAATARLATTAFVDDTAGAPASTLAAVGFHVFNTATVRTANDTFTGLATAARVDGASTWTDQTSSVSACASGVVTASVNASSTYAMTLTGTTFASTPAPIALAGLPTSVLLKNVDVEAVLPFVAGSDFTLSDSVADATCLVVTTNNFTIDGQPLAPASCSSPATLTSLGVDVGTGACLHCN